RDLPTFDSVWIDALVQIRRLTPYQAKRLESDGPEALLLGPFRICERVDGNARFETYRAVNRETGRPILLTRFELEPSFLQRGLDRFRTYLDQSRGLSSPSLCIAFGCAADGETVSAASRWVEGPTLRELLLRRGRFPPEVVSAVGRQICEALATLQTRELPHGDLRLETVRLAPEGECVLLHAGLLASLAEGPSIHVGLPFGCYDTVAPELIDSHRPASAASDAYALGCVLWELLAGRPPFPHGDPLAKLAAHQTRSVPDLENYAPDAPSRLRALVSSLTARNPEDRPTDFRRIAVELGRRRTARRRLASFLGTFKTAARARNASNRRGRNTARAAITATMLLALVSVMLLDAGARSEMLAIAGRAPEQFKREISALLTRDDPSASDEEESVEAALLPFPVEIVDGTIELDSAGPYAAAEIAAVGPLTIRAGAGLRPVIVIRDAPLRVWAESLILEGVTLRTDDAETSPQPTPRNDSRVLLKVDAERFATKACTFHNGRKDVAGVAIQWRPLEGSSATGRQIVLVETVFTGSATSVHVLSLPSTFRANNVLKCGAVAFLEVSSDSRTTGREWRMGLDHVTLRDATSLVRWSAASADDVPAPVELSLEECVLDLPAGAAAIVEFAKPPSSSLWQQLVRVTGRASLVRPGTVIARVADAKGEAAQPLPSDGLAIEGLLSSEFEFSGPPLGDPRDSIVTGYHGYGLSEQPPGADARSLPSVSIDAYNSRQTSAIDPGDQIPDAPGRFPAGRATRGRPTAMGE
ncbi:MAG: hypothetical protein DWQ29_09830, partial [Planctomycetota bacterium]